MCRYIKVPTGKKWHFANVAGYTFYNTNIVHCIGNLGGRMARKDEEPQQLGSTQLLLAL